MMKKLCSLLLCLLLVLTLSISAFAMNAGYAHVMDYVGLLSAPERDTLCEKLDEISLRLDFDVVVVAVPSTEGMEPMDFADDYYDYNGYGLGENRDGVLLLLSMENRDYWISTRGYGQDALPTETLIFIEEQFLPLISQGNYFAGFCNFADWVDSCVTSAKNGSPIDEYNLPKAPFAFGSKLVVSLIIGLILGAIVVLILKGQLKSVKAKNNAADYVRSGSLNLTQSQDLFLYHTVNRIRKPEPSQRSGGGSHISSSGASHGGHGGHF